ncbi:unnamed protein product [Didymodactylos carnosus]|uniref:Helix-turn-helix domain-containing protein n=1 Tax=Didymodactylos carnosus TaxID=1234261 RepID=A0A815WHV1_9BILA|nr:unnamed protein product [Didymodactylos carnosus]CAF4405646.1 unnamed protein product [Didymodactylos carnosus]
MYNNNGLHRQYIDDTIIVINWTKEQSLEEIKEWNRIDPNIQLTATIGSTANFLDLHMENKNGQIEYNVFHKPSYEPYYLPFSSVQPLHMKRNIPFATLIRAFRYFSDFQIFMNDNKFEWHFS